jgi:tetratricopeptide (TPR) repeat protein
MRIKDFFQKRKTLVKYLIIGIPAAIVIAVAVFIFFDKRGNKLLVRYEAIMDEYGNTAPDDSAKIAGIIEKLTELKSDALFGHVYENALWSLGNLCFDQGRFDEAYKIFAEFAGDTSSDIYASIALLKAGSAAEEEGSLDKALDIYKKLEKEYAGGVCADNIFYSLARTYNLKGDFSQAGKYYNIVITDYPNSIFAESARKRLFWVKRP